MDFAVQALAEFAGHILGDAVDGKKKKKRTRLHAGNGSEDSPEN